MSILKRIFEIFLIALVYFLSGKLGQTMAIPPGNVTPVWPPSGIALALLLLLGNRRAIPGLFIGAFFANISFFDGATDGMAIAKAFSTGLGIAVGSVLQPLLGVYLIHRFINQGDPLHRIKNFLSFIAVIPIMCLISASLGTISLVLGGFAPWVAYIEIWPTWWLGDSIGVLVAAPLVLAWWHHWQIKTTPAEVLETAAIFVGLCVTSWMAFGLESQVPLAFLPVPILLWAGLRLDLRGTVLAILMVEGIAIWSTLQGLGPFQSDDLNHSLMLLQLFIAVFTTTTMIVALFVKERDQAQERLQQERQNQFVQLVEGLGGKYFYFTHNTVGVFTYVSESIRKILGYAPEEFKRHFETFLPDTPLNQAAVAHTEGSIRGEQQSIYEIDIFHKDGSTRRIEVFERPVFDDEGQVVGVEGMSCDITDRIAEGEKFAALLNSAPDGMIISNDQGKMTLVNTRAEEMFGYHRDELIGQSVEMLIPNDLRPSHIELRNTVDIGDAIDHMGLGREVVGLRKDGLEFSIEINLSPIKTDEGMLFSAAIRDITERKKAEQALRDGEEYKSAILESSLDCLISMDHEGHITEFNPAAEKVFGYKREDVIGKILSETIVPPAFREAHDNGLKHFLQTGEGSVLNQRIEITALHASGEEFPVELAISSIERGDAPVFTAFIRDITERKHAEEILASRNQDLIAARDESEKAAREAEAANQAKSIFLANMSHEIRTPMNAILGFSDILGSTLTEPQQKTYLDSIQSSGKSLLTLINDILDLSKVEAGKLELVLSSIETHKVFLDIEQEFAQTIKEKQLELEIDIHSDVPDLLSLDGTRLRQVLVNVVGNAVKFTEEGRVMLRVSSTKSRGNHVNLAIEVEDTGVGIPEDQIDRIFGAFEQRAGQSINQYGGTGLGLAISTRLIDMMGGEIGVISQLGKGSTFTIILNDVKVASTDDAVDQVLSVDIETVSFDPATILVTDDIEVNRELIKGYLLPYGFTLFEARDGQIAIDLMRKQKPDLTLMDIKMPVLDGYTATKLIRKNAEVSDLVVVALTDAAMRETEEEISQICDGFLQNPVSKKALITELIKHLPHHIISPEIDTSNASPESASTELTSEALEKLPTLIEQLKEHQETSADLAHTQTINEVEDFAQHMQSLGEEYAYPPLVQWGEQLLLQATMFDLEKMGKTLVNYGRLIEEAESQLVSTASTGAENEVGSIDLGLLLNTLYLEKETWETLSQTLTINDIEDFAQRMHILGQGHSYEPLIDWSAKLIEQASLFDMDNMAKTLGRYPELINAIEAQL